MAETTPSLPAQRPSRCAEAALRAEIKRVHGMTMEERVREALSLRNHLSWISPEPKTKRENERES